MLNTVTYGTKTDARPLLVVHGLFGSARNWGAIAKRLSDRGEVTSVDLRNHGDSPWRDSHSYADMAGDLAAMIGDGTDVIGHSMGGKAAMLLALTQPHKVNRLVVADIAPVSYGHTQMHLIDAMRRIDLSAVETRRDADEQLAAEIREPGVRAFLLQSLDVKARRWRLNLDVLADEMDKILAFPAVEDRYEGPALFLVGSESDYVKREDRPRIKDLFPRARFAKLPGAGHWLHAERPREFEAAARTFFDA